MAGQIRTETWRHSDSAGPRRHRRRLKWRRTDWIFADMVHGEHSRTGHLICMCNHLIQIRTKVEAKINLQGRQMPIRVVAFVVVHGSCQRLSYRSSTTRLALSSPSGTATSTFPVTYPRHGNALVVGNIAIASNALSPAPSAVRPVRRVDRARAAQTGRRKVPRTG